MGQVRLEPVVVAEQPGELGDLVDGELLVALAPLADQVDVAGLVGSVVLGARLQVGVA
jgi:hypothetical protein